MKLRIQSKVIGVFPHSIKPVINIRQGTTLKEAVDITRQFSTCWHPAKVVYTLERRGSLMWFPIRSFVNGERINTHRGVSNCTQAKTEEQALSDGYF